MPNNLLARLPLAMQRARIPIALAGWVIYLGALLLLYFNFGLNANALEVLPVILSAWLLGWRAGLVIGIVSYPLNVLVFWLLGYSRINAMLGWPMFPPIVGMTAIGGIVGWLRELRNMLQRQLAEHARVQETLRASEALLNASQRLSQVGGWEWHVERQRIFWTEETYRIHDLTPGEMVVGSPEHISRSSECYRPEDRPVILAAFQRCAEQGEPYDLELPFTSATGRPLWIRTTARAIREQGRIVKVIGTIMDITERKRTEAALRESEEKYHRLVESAPLGIFQSTAEGQVISVNQMFAQMFGYDSTADTLKNVQNVATDIFADPNRRNELIRLMAENPQLRTFENLYRRKDGSTFIGRLNIAPVQDAEGRLMRAEGIIEDITEHKRVEESLRESENTLRVWLNAIQESAFLVNPDGIILAANTTVAQRMNHTVAEMLGTNIFDLVPPEVARARRRHVDEVIKTGQPAHFEDERFGRIIENSIYPVLDQDGHIRQLAILGTDITERKRMENALKMRESHLTAIIENQPGLVSLKDLQGRFLAVNGAFALACKKNPAEILDKTDLEIWEPDLAKKYRADDLQVIQQKKPLHVEESFMDEQERMRWFETFKTPAFDEHGQVIGTTSFARDITEQRRAENVLQARLRLSEFADSHSLDELLQKALDEAEALTGSRIGFFHFLESDQKTIELQTWSTNTLAKMCTAEGKGQHYNVDMAGVWVDCIHMRQPVVHNDYAGLPATRRKGLPAGHAPVIRELTVPVLRGGLVVAIVGVGNKQAAYDAQDVEAVSQLANLAWEIVLRKRAEEALRVSEDKYRTVADFTYDWEVWRAPDTSYVYISPSCKRITGYRADEFLADPNLMIKIVHPDDRPEFIEHYRAITHERNAQDQHLDFRIVTANGEIRWINHYCTVVHTEDGRWLGRRESNRDITARKLAEESLRKSEEKWRSLVSATPDYIALQDAEGRFQFLNHYAKGFNEKDVIGSSVYQYLSLESVETFRRNFEKALSSWTLQCFEYTGMGDWGEMRTYEQYIIPMRDKNQEITILAISRDISERKQAELELRYAKETLESVNHELNKAFLREQQLAHTDGLTGLKNRTHFFDLAAQEFGVAARYQQPLTVIMFDIDHFKQVNDTYGHQMGDVMLKAISQIASEQMRETDILARYGGEEFVALFPQSDAQQTVVVAERIRQAIGAYVQKSGADSVSVTVSLGIAEILSQGDSLDYLVQRADQALYVAKATGRNKVVIFSPPMQRSNTQKRKKQPHFYTPSDGKNNKRP
jgi:diguanylate cyclase (GGDEF)-like protein/PAS domain S-box-containing protein